MKRIFGIIFIVLLSIMSVEYVNARPGYGYGHHMPSSIGHMRMRQAIHHGSMYGSMDGQNNGCGNMCDSTYACGCNSTAAQKIVSNKPVKKYKSSAMSGYSGSGEWGNPDNNMTVDNKETSVSDPTKIIAGVIIAIGIFFTIYLGLLLLCL